MSAEEKALRAHKDLIGSLVSTFLLTTTLDEDDLRQEASIAFLKAFRSWKPDGGRSLESWAFQLIERRLIDLARNNGSENQHRTDPPPPSDRDESDRREPVDRMDLLKSSIPSQDDLVDELRGKKAIDKALSQLTVEDREFLLKYEQLGVNSFIREQMHLPAEVEISSTERSRVSRRAQELRAQVSANLKRSA